MGEGGPYLHGAPDFLTLGVQTDVPMVIWISARFRDNLRPDQACIRTAAEDSVRHDNMFSVVPGILDVMTMATVAGPDLAGARRKLAR